MEAWSFEFEDCLHIVKKEWMISDEGSMSVRLLRKLKRVRNAIRVWTLSKRREWSQQWTDFDKDLEMELEKVFNGHNESDYVDLHSKYIEFNRAATLFWKQRAKINWIKEGDACTRFFFNSVKNRYNRNFIVGVKRSDSTWAFDNTEVVDLFNVYFHEIYRVHTQQESFQQYSRKYMKLFSNLKFKLDDDQRDSFSKLFSRKEVRTAVFQLGPLKSPGPDGIPALFYQKYWFHVKREVEEAVLEILNKGIFPAEFNRTSIVLIPKTGTPEKVENYRPISLCNVIIKIVTKCISNRLKRVMSSLVGEYQNGFIPGRHISDNVLLSHELFHHISRKKKGKKGLLAIKVDMSKAYDRLNWNFIRCTLVAMNFPEIFIDLIMNCVSSVSYEVLLNGSPGKSFKPKAGVRQGDPISPYLFALGTEVLSQLLCVAQEKELLNGISVCRGATPISHLLFADDAIFFLEANQKSCQILCDILKDYCTASGQLINVDKTSITFSPSCTMRVSKDCMKILKAPGNKELGLYLGLPTDFGSSKKEVFALVVEKVRKRILSWNNSFLSPAGRLTLICSVLSSLSIYSLSAFKMPVSVSSKINSLISQFWWRGTAMRVGLHWSSNLFLNAPKSSGGLGIRNISCLNQSLLAKIGWRILQFPNSLIGRVLGKKYNLSFASIMSPSYRKLGCQSWGERGITWGLELLRLQSAYQIGFPSTLDLWRDNWLHGLNLAQLLNVPDHVLASKPKINVCQLHDEHGVWDSDLIRKLCGSPAIPFILAVPVPPVDSMDMLYWKATKTGKYSIKSGYAIAFANLWEKKASSTDLNRMDPITISFCKQRLWRLPISAKWKVFLWKILSDSLPCGAAAMKRNLNWNFNCRFCLSETDNIESLNHLFRDCPTSSRIWLGSPLGIRSNVGNNISIQRWIINWCTLLTKEKGVDAISFFCSTLWQIWCLRNDHCFRQPVSSFSAAMLALYSDAMANITAHGSAIKSKDFLLNMDIYSSHDVVRIKDHFPVAIIADSLCGNHVRLKCDASWTSDFRGTAGWFFKDMTGAMVQFGQRRFWASSPLQAECLALFFAVSDGLKHGFEAL
ncbi:uncharacterized protein LOC141590510 [Silene latifolia]|uniref:uncharacterized protein LOC141590510 n=1 Tax=Silene latifolia TaxID=37657 RepID=UPI003D76AC3A